MFDSDRRRPSYATFLKKLDLHEEFPRVWFDLGGHRVLHIVLPHLQILFDYLMKRDVRIALLSSGVERCNLSVIRRLLEAFWGSRGYEALKSRGQFTVYGMDDLRKGNFSLYPEGNYVKDLRRVLQGGESLSNAVLVDDDRCASAHDQEPLVIVKIFNEDVYLDDDDYSGLNNIYYLMGLFGTYFENEEYNRLPLNEALRKILSTCRPECDERHRQRPDCHIFQHDDKTFVHKMIDVGLAAVQKVVPNATVYLTRGSV